MPRQGVYAAMSAGLMAMLRKKSFDGIVIDPPPTGGKFAMKVAVAAMKVIMYMYTPCTNNHALHRLHTPSWLSVSCHHICL